MPATAGYAPRCLASNTAARCTICSSYQQVTDLGDFADTEEVTGSIPVSPTRNSQQLGGHTAAADCGSRSTDSQPDRADYAAAVSRRGWGDDGIYWVESRKRLPRRDQLRLGARWQAGAEGCLRPDQAGGQGQAQGSARGRRCGSKDLSRIHASACCQRLGSQTAWTTRLTVPWPDTRTSSSRSSRC